MYPKLSLQKLIDLDALGSIFACILNTKPLKSFSLGLTNRESLSLGLGVGAISIKQSNNSLTPKLFKAEPKIQVVILRLNTHFY